MLESFFILHRAHGASPCVASPAAVSSFDGGPKLSKLKLWPAIPANNLASGGGPYVRLRRPVA